DARKLQAVVGDELFQLLPAGLSGVRIRRGVQAEAAQLDTLVAEVVQHVDHLVEVGSRFLLVEDVGPAADGEFAFHVSTSWKWATELRYTDKARMNTDQARRVAFILLS